MGSFQDFMDNLGFGASSSEKKAGDLIGDARNNYATLTPPNLKPVMASSAETANATAGQVTPAAAAIAGQADVTQGRAGQASAQRGQAYQQGASNYNNISTDPANKQAQAAQMAALSRLSASGGRSEASDANLAAIEQNENANARGQRDAIMARANARGQGGGGAALLAQLNASQNATNNQSARDLGVSGQESDTATRAGSDAARIGAGLESQNYNEAAQRAAANDAVARYNSQNNTNASMANAAQANEMGRFNAGQRTGVSMGNAAAANQLGEFNAGQRSGVSMFNTGQGNQTGEFNAGQTTGVNLANAGNTNANNRFNAAQNTGVSEFNNYTEPQAGYGNQLQRAGGMSSADKMGTDYYGRLAGIKAKQSGNLLGSGIQLGTAAGPAIWGGLGDAGTAVGGWFGGLGGADGAASAGAGEIVDEAAVGGATGAEGVGIGAEEAAPVLAAAGGGRVPGRSMVPGNSLLNDKVNLKASPHEVVVPVDLAQGGSEHDIASFVKNPPPIRPMREMGAMPQARQQVPLDPNKDRVAMLSALRHLSQHGARQ